MTGVSNAWMSSIAFLRKHGGRIYEGQATNLSQIQSRRWKYFDFFNKPVSEVKKPFTVIKKPDKVVSTGRPTLPGGIQLPGYAQIPSVREHELYEVDQPIVWRPDEISRIRTSCQIAKRTLQKAEATAEVGMTTDHLEQQILKEVLNQGAYPSLLGFFDFPKAVSSAVNNVVAHGVPDLRPLEDGDIITLDLAVFKDGFHGSITRTFVIGQR